jgi:hypothetical protein
MLGLSLGTPVEDVRKVLGISSGAERQEVEFLNSPPMIADSSKEGVIFLRAANIDVSYAWQDVLARLIFDREVLTSVIVLSNQTDGANQYKGRLLDKIGLGSPVADLAGYGEVEYDDADELFYMEEFKGLEIGGTSACDLLTDPAQVITFIRIF